MKKILILLAISTLGINSVRADFGVTPTGVTPNGQTTISVTEKAVADNNLQGIVNPKISAEDFIKLTPKKVKKELGRNLKIKEVLALKAAQKAVKKEISKNQGGGDIPQIAYIVLAIFGFAWIAMGIMDDWSGNDWIINLVLVILCFIPGLIHALVKMSKYY